MKKLLNTLYITSENKYLSLDGENVVIKEEGAELGRMPLHNLEMIVTFSRAGASPALMGKCFNCIFDAVRLIPGKGRRKDKRKCASEEETV